jgi:hypothetical protein
MSGKETDSLRFTYVGLLAEPSAFRHELRHLMGLLVLPWQKGTASASSDSDRRHE